jgi:hypothetical protein
MTLTYAIDPADDWPVFDFTETITYDPTGASAAITGLTAIRRPISQSAGRRIEQFDIGDGLNPDDVTFHVCENTNNDLANITLTPYDFDNDLPKDTITDDNSLLYDVIFAERQVDNSKLFVVARKRRLYSALISYWKLDELSGNAADAHGSNTLTDTNTVTAGTGLFSQARDFEATNTEYLTINDNATFQIGDTDLTIQAWVKAESLSGVQDNTILSKFATNEKEYYIAYEDTAQRFFFSISNDGSTDTIVTANNLGAPATGTWYHILAWIDTANNQIAIQINQGTADTASFTTRVYHSAAPFRIGASGQTGNEAPWDGLIDEVAIWKRLLTTAEKTRLYNSGQGLAYENF